MRPNVFLDRLRKGDVLLGLCNMYPAAGIIECMSQGWDFIWIDGQHGQMSYDSCLNAVIACAAANIEAIVRVPGHEFGVVGPFIDLGPSAVMVPMVNNQEQAKAVVNALRFAPLGMRSYGGRRVIDIDGREYYREREVAVLAQIETKEAVENASSIARTEGIDILFFGPDDMKVQMGLPINTSFTENSQLREALAQTAKACKAAGKFAGCVAVTPAAVSMAVELGYQVIVGGGDVAFLRNGSSEKIAELRKVLGGAKANTPKKTVANLYGG